MDPELLAKLFTLNHFVIKKNTQGLTHADSLLQPQPGGNCLNWILGHIVANRNRALELLGQPPIWLEPEAAPYQSGTGPISSSDQVQPLEKILADLDGSQERLLAALQHISSEELAATAGEETIYHHLGGLHFHEAYHAGQTEYLRELTGKKGALG